jgi:hypothetical protein
MTIHLKADCLKPSATPYLKPKRDGNNHTWNYGTLVHLIGILLLQVPSQKNQQHLRLPNATLDEIAGSMGLCTGVWSEENDAGWIDHVGSRHIAFNFQSNRKHCSSLIHQYTAWISYLDDCGYGKGVEETL